MSYNSHNVELGCIYNLKNEERKNWVKLEPRSATEGFESISMRLDASTVFEFMKAVRADVMKYVSRPQRGEVTDSGRHFFVTPRS